MHISIIIVIVLLLLSSLLLLLLLSLLSLLSLLIHYNTEARAGGGGQLRQALLAAQALRHLQILFGAVFFFVVSIVFMNYISYMLIFFGRSCSDSFSSSGI